MADNIYTGPGWYWIEGRDNPVEVRTNPMFGILEGEVEAFFEALELRVRELEAMTPRTP